MLKHGQKEEKFIGLSKGFENNTKYFAPERKVNRNRGFKNKSKLKLEIKF